MAQEKKHVTIYLDSEFKKKLELFAKFEKRSLTSQIEWSLERMLKIAKIAEKQNRSIDGVFDDILKRFETEIQ